MSILKGKLASDYESKIARIHDTIDKELNERQAILEKHGFKVRRSEAPVNYEAALSLVAERDNVALKVTRFVSGGKALSIVLKKGDMEKTVPLYSCKFADALAFANIAKHVAL